MFSKRTAHKEVVVNPRAAELKEQLRVGTAVYAMAQSQGWKVLDAKLQERRSALLQELVDAKVLTDVPMLQAQLRELDAILKIVPDEILRGEEARAQIEQTLEKNNG